MSLFDLSRFISAQDQSDTYQTAINEIRAGRKQTHWIWFVFPQIAGLGRSAISAKYSIGTILEARAFYEESTLRGRLTDAAHEVYSKRDWTGCSMDELFRELDAMKVRSCMTLFNYVEPGSIFQKVLDTCYDGIPCKLTQAIVGPQYEWIRRPAFTENGLLVHEKAFMESSSYEAKEYSFEQRLGTLISLCRKGESMNQMVQHYLWSRDCSDYRMSEISSILANMLQRFFIAISNVISDKSEIQTLKSLYQRIDESDNVLEAAHLFDDVMKELAKGPSWCVVADKFLTYSILAP